MYNRILVPVDLGDIKVAQPAFGDTVIQATGTSAAPATMAIAAE